ncbi:MAG: metal ABC transporter substrate-binding protein [Candidatus Adiutrix sp.]|jgi:ABC-type Zn uptake system ZnuABC Zn-binding protein ZnuA|nr:metal ABC transporter substrate-binding protein [Candidatus Adiutrix sp.]
MKCRTLTIFLLALLLLPAGPAASLAAGEILCSTFPVWLFTRNIIEGSPRFQAGLMIGSQLGCPHDYSPTQAELERLSRAEILVINGLGLEAFLSRSLGVAKAGLKIIDASGGRDPDQDSRSGPAALVIDKESAVRLPGHHQDGPNPHIFAAPGQAAGMVRNIGEALASLDMDNAELYLDNAAKLADELETLAASARNLGQELGRPKIISSHGVFDYLARDLGLSIVSHIEEEDGAAPSAARLAALVKLARQDGVRAVLTDPQGNINLARTLGAEARLPVAVIDPVSAGPPDAPLDYYQKVMKTNLEVMKKLFAAPPPSSGRESVPAKRGQQSR